MAHRNRPSWDFPALPNAEARRAALRRYRILGTGPERDFDRVTRLLAQTCGAPVALIALLDEDRQWLKSCYGYQGARETDLGLPFAARAVRQRDTLVVENAAEEARFSEAPAVTGERGWRFYAGTPLQTPEGVIIGTLCIVDHAPRVFDAGQRAVLEDLADVVVGHLEQRHAEEQRRQYQRLVENVQEVVFETDLEGHTTFVNGAWESVTGFSAEEALGESLVQFVHPKDRAETLRAFAPLLKRQQDLFHHETRFLTAGGTEQPVEFRARLTTDEDGAPAGTVGTLTPTGDFSPRVTEESEKAAPGAAPPLAPANDSSEGDDALADEPEADEPELDELPPSPAEADEEDPDEAAPLKHVAGTDGSDEEDAASLGEDAPPVEEPPAAPEETRPAVVESTIEPESEGDAVEEELFAGLSDWGEAPPAEDESQIGDEPLPGDASADAPPDGGEEKAPSDPARETDELPSKETAPAEADVPSAAPSSIDAPSDDDVGDAAPAGGGSFEEEIDEATSGTIAQGFPELETVEREADFAGDETLDDVRRRLSTDPPNLRLSSFDYAEHLGALLDELEPAARRKGLVMHRALPDRSVSVEADPGALRLLVAALVGHAVDATDEGSITVSGRARGTGEVHLRVVDTGADISQNLLNSLLDTGTAPPDADDAEAKPEKRHLSFVHRLVNLMRGAVEMESRRGRGTVFTVILPRHPDAEASVPGVAAPAETTASPAETDDPDGAPSEWIPTAEEPPAEEPLAETAPAEPEAAPADDDTPASPAANEPGNGDDEELLSWERDSIFNTSSEEPEANDDSDAFRTDPDSPFSF
jgi:PAS domain S-box-containing protein